MQNCSTPTNPVQGPRTFQRQRFAGSLVEGLVGNTSGYRPVIFTFHLADLRAYTECEPILALSLLTTYESTSQRDSAQVFEPQSAAIQTPSPQQRSPTLSSFDPASSSDYDQPMVDMGDDLDLDELLLP